MNSAATKLSGAAVRRQNASAASGTPQTKWKLLAYGVLALPLSLAGLPILTYLPAFYAQELHLSAGLVGVVFLCARAWDAVSNLLVGWLSDHTVSRWGRRKPWVIVAAPFLMVSTWYLCNPPQGAGLGYLAVWVALFYISWVAMYVPYLSWGTELATEYTERSRVTSFRETFTMLGNLFFAAGPLLFLADDAPLREVLLLISLAVLLMLPFAMLPLGFSVRDAAPTQRQPSHSLKELVALVKDRVLTAFIVATLAYAVGEGVVNSLLVFFFGTGLELPNRLFWAIFVLYVSTLCSVPLLLRLTRYVEKHRLLAAAMALQVMMYAVFVVIPPRNFPAVVALEITLGIANSALLVLPTSILADIIDHGDAASGQRRSGAYVAVYNLMLKLGMAVGVGLAFGALALLNYEPGAAHYGAADVTHIRLLTFGLPCLLQIPAIILYFKHPITREIQRQLRERIHRRYGPVAPEWMSDRP